MTRVVAFDIGKVLLDFDYGIFVRNMVPHTKLSVGELDELLNTSPLLAEYESGSIDTQTFYELIRKATGFTGDLKLFGGFFEAIFDPIQEIIDVQRRLHEKGVPTYTLSNTNELAVRHIAQTYDFWSRFEGHVLSYEAKSLKPAARIYEVFEVTTGCEGQEIVYLDDRPENIVAAKKRGWNAWQHVEPDQTLNVLATLGLPVNP